MSKIKLTRKNVNIKVRDYAGNESLAQVTAWVYDDLLAFYKGINGQWVLTHVPTGVKLGDYQGKYSGLRTLMAIIAKFEIDWLITNPAILLSLLETNKPYDAYSLIKLLLSDAIDLEIVLNLMTDGYVLSDVITKVDKILEVK